MSVHEDTVQGLKETLEYARGNLQLKATVVEVPDKEITFYSIYGKLSVSESNIAVEHLYYFMPMHCKRHRKAWNYSQHICRLHVSQVHKQVLFMKWRNRDA